MAKKYICWSGNVTSCDGDIHFISGREVARLYGVLASECHFADLTKPETYLGYNLKRFNHLYPQSDGNYKLNG